ncbi:MAG: hypothetical protein AAB152_15510 [Candidatus Coatesbacteria bacterium]
MTDETDGAAEVKWEQRIGQNLIRRLYDSEASGLLDEALLDDVGTRLGMRCEAVLAVSEAMRGRVACPRCARAGTRTIITRTAGDEAEALQCPVCGWATTWGAYHKRCRSQQLNEGGAGYAFRAFLAQWKAAATPAMKMIAVDQLIHEFHVYLMRHRVTGETKNRHARVVAVQLIQGTATEVMGFLEDLSGTAPRSSDLAASAVAWRARAAEAREDPPWEEWSILQPSR